MLCTLFFLILDVTFTVNELVALTVASKILFKKLLRVTSIEFRRMILRIQTWAEMGGRSSSFSKFTHTQAT